MKFFNPCRDNSKNSIILILRMSNVSQSLLCPITQSIMVNPVIAEDGYTYERDAIINWLRQSNLSPMTRRPISASKLMPNRAIMDVIDLCNNPQIVSLGNSSNGSISANSATSPNLDEFVKTVKYIKSAFGNSSRQPRETVYKYTKISPHSPIPDKRIGTTYICMIDVSGSMGALCSNKSDDRSNTESDGFSRLDLTKHSLNTIIEMLDPNDVLVIIKFSTTSECVFEGKIDSYGKSEAKRVVAALQPENSTNIWSSIQMGYNYAKRSIQSYPNNNIKMLLLTDGESNIDPPMGILPSLSKYLNASANADIKDIELTTFGFSCDVDSKLLFNIAEMTNSGFNFIPDSSMVGTTFINFLANTLATENVRHIVEICDEVPNESDIITDTDLDISELYEIVRYQTYLTLKKMCDSTDCKRRLLLDGVKNPYRELQEYVMGIIDAFKSAGIGENQYKMFVELYKDIFSSAENEGQIYKAISSQQWFHKWGYHYLLSLGRAHCIRKCHNFRDKGIQSYGGTQFETLRETANDVFCQIPPPQPSASVGYGASYGGRYGTSYNASQGGHGQAQPRVQSMASYVNSSGPCFAPFCTIRLANGQEKRLDMLDGTEELYFDGQTTSKIKYVTKTRVLEPKSMIKMCSLNGLVVTPWHPVCDSNSSTWVFPNKVSAPFEMPMEYIYNIVLDRDFNQSAYYVWINNIKCVSMAHGLTEFNNLNQILSHPYYGTNKVIQDLENFRNDNERIITLERYELRRDSNELICQIVRV
jgi:Hint-domain/VWA / Hh  protein intein-like/U-box domain/von Willebrand factor type A domain